MRKLGIDETNDTRVCYSPMLMPYITCGRLDDARATFEMRVKDRAKSALKRSDIGRESTGKECRKVDGINDSGMLFNCFSPERPYVLAGGRAVDRGSLV